MYFTATLIEYTGYVSQIYNKSNIAWLKNQISGMA